MSWIFGQNFLRRGLESPQAKKALWLARWSVGLSPKDNGEVGFRLDWKLGDAPRYQSGWYHFPFGTVQYIDGMSLAHQFREIFIERGYDFETDNPTPRILDCGGNIGMSVLRFRLCHPSARIDVFEADAAIADLLRANLTAHQVGDVVIHHAAVMNFSGHVSFVNDRADAGHVADGMGTVEVPAIRLADCINEPIDLLKMDIEGAEYRVLQDLCRSGKIAFVKRVICEIHGSGKNAAALGQLVADLADAGFALTINHAISAPFMCGLPEPAPFPAVADGKYLAHLYAWRP